MAAAVGISVYLAVNESVVYYSTKSTPFRAVMFLVMEAMLTAEILH